jgi:hypothetical protein
VRLVAPPVVQRLPPPSVRAQQPKPSPHAPCLGTSSDELPKPPPHLPPSSCHTCVADPMYLLHTRLHAAHRLYAYGPHLPNRHPPMLAVRSAGEHPRRAHAPPPPPPRASVPVGLLTLGPAAPSLRLSHLAPTLLAAHPPAAHPRAAHPRAVHPRRRATAGSRVVSSTQHQAHGTSPHRGEKLLNAPPTAHHPLGRAPLGPRGSLQLSVRYLVKGMGSVS